nr:ribonucleoside-triphosphate reductase, adenosylcobalamin-dependent [Cytobacillus praedii]
MEFISNQFVQNTIAKNPKPLNELGEFVYYRTYSRWLEHRGRREFWHETVKRAIEFNMALAYKHTRDMGYKVNLKQMKKEAEQLFKNVYEKKQFLSGRTFWVGNANPKINKEFVLGNFNCSFINIASWDDLGDLFYLLLVGTGVGFKSTKKMASKMPKIRTNVKLLHSEYKPVSKEQRLEHTKVTRFENGFAKIYVGDSKEGWVESLREFLKILTYKEFEDIHTIKISYNSVRPKGERLLTFGGTASGHEPLKEMFEGFDNVLKNKIDSYLAPIVTDEKGYGQIRPIHILDMGNLVGANVVVGGVRRTAEIFLFDHDDYECLLAKYGINGIWTEAQLSHHQNVGKMLESKGVKPEWFDNISKIGDGRYGFDHRRMSNNSVAFEKQPLREELHLLFVLLQMEGEPGFINLEEARRRRPNAEGLNPCAEILLDSYGVCNLTTVNVKEFVYSENGVNKLDVEGLLKAQRLSARIGLRMTLAELELPHWDKIQQRDRLLGTSVTGWQDAMTLLKLSQEDEIELLKLMGDAARSEADKYAKELRISSPLLVTTVKPEGTLSQVAGGVSSGLHHSHSPYYIRRIRINSNDPLAKVALDLGWNVNPEVGTQGDTHEDRMNNARTWVIDFPVESGAERTKDDVSVKEQFDTYFNFQRYYTEHNTSNTITVRPEEWGNAEQIVFDNWDDFVGVSFLQLDGGTYQLAPYEKINEDEYHDLKTKMKLFDPTLLHKYEQSETVADLDSMESCESGVCPIR